MIIPPNSPRWAMEARPIQGLSQRELENPEGVGFDLRVAEIFEINGRGHLGVEMRNTPQSTSIGNFEINGNKILTLQAGKYYLAKTIETVSFPLSLGGVVFPRSTLFRSGITLESSIVPAGYSGPLTFGLAVWSNEGFELQLGARFAHLVVMEVGSGATNYEGQWNGGRVSVTIPEVQK